MHMLFLLVAAQAMPMAGPAHSDVACPATPVAPPAALAGWSRALPAKAGRDARNAAAITLDTGIRATLLPTPRVSYALRPEHPGGSVSSGGLFAFTAPAAGRYKVSLGSAAWIDVVKDGRAETSVAHGPGPACTGMRKTVDFDLVPGRYLLQVAGNGSATLPLMVSRLK